MTFYLYQLRDGSIELLDYKLPDGIPDPPRLVMETQTRVVTQGMTLNEDDQLVPAPVPYSERRRRAYPKVGDQLDMLWHAMNDGQIPKVEPFYSEILTVKQTYPKPSN
jgi:hypothetical protein